MAEFFVGLLNRSIAAAWLVIFVIAVRVLFKNMPQWCRFVLWGMVAFLLVLPFAPENFIVVPTEKTTIGRIVFVIAFVLWFVVMLGFYSYGILNYLKKKYRYRMAISYDEKIYYDDNVTTPVVLGALEPHLYLPKDLPKEQETEFIEKENYRILHGVYFFRALNGVLHSIYWFQPVLWVGYYLFSKDLDQVGVRKKKESVLRQVFAVFVCAVVFVLCAGMYLSHRAGLEQAGKTEQTEEETEPKEEEIWTYMHPRTGLTITLKENGTASITDMVSSIFPNGVSGTYSRKKNILTITSADGENEYHFLMDGYNLIFYKYISSDISTVSGRVKAMEDEAYFEPMFDAGQGVYYPGLKNPEMYYNSMAIGAGYLFGDLYYQERVYKEKESYRSEEKSDLPMELLEEELGPAYGNSVGKWSYRSDFIGDFFAGTMYRVKGYEENYRVAIYYEEKEIIYEQVQVGEHIYTGKPIGTGKTRYYCIKIVDCLNDIWLYRGEDLFEDRMHLENSVSVSLFPDGREEILTDFYTALNNATFVDEDEESLPDFEKEVGKKILFQDSFGFLTELTVYESGYVVHEANSNIFIAKVAPELCKCVMEKAK